MKTGYNAIREQAIHLLEEDQCGDAITFLEKHIATNNPVGEWHALLGIAHFRCGEYHKAASCYEQALGVPTDHPDANMWLALRTNALANIKCRISEPVPALRFFDREQLLEAAESAAAALPVVNDTLPTQPITKKLKKFAQDVFGNLVSFISKVFISLAGKLKDYRDDIWTNWYRRKDFYALLTLAYMREKLNKENLHDTYPKGVLTGFETDHRKPTESVKYFRTADGSWNNLQNPKEGAANTRFSRNVTNQAIREELSHNLLDPNPRQISLALLARENGMKEVPFLNMLAAAWIQFQTHDWVSHGENQPKDQGVFEIPLAEDDPARRKYHQQYMYIQRTQPDPTHKAGEQTPITFINEVTHWWDGSQIYGSDDATLRRLRSHEDGKLRLEADGTLPIRDDVEDTGFNRNWWVGLTILHTLFVKEHNAICDMLKTEYPQWSDDRLFNVARLINAAVMAKVHTIEWTPAILPNRAAVAGLNANWYGLRTYFWKRRKRRKALRWFNIRNPEAGGVVGNPIDRHGAPYSLSEEFSEIYRLHSLLPDTLNLRRIGGGRHIQETLLAETRQAQSKTVIKEFGVANLLYSFGNQHPGQLVLNNYPKFMQEMSVPGNPLFDLGTLDILRARERGVPRYNEFRHQLGLKRIRSFHDLTDDKTARKLKEIYGDRPKDVNKLDLLIGTLAESHRPTGFGFGETLFQIFILNATRRLQADRFYTDCYNEETYTIEGLKWIDDASLKSVLLRHYPELARTGLANVRNAFEPWDEDNRLNPDRHPLRAFDKEIRHDPWLGDNNR